MRDDDNVLFCKFIYFVSVVLLFFFWAIIFLISILCEHEHVEHWRKEEKTEKNKVVVTYTTTTIKKTKYHKIYRKLCFLHVITHNIQPNRKNLKQMTTRHIENVRWRRSVVRTINTVLSVYIYYVCLFSFSSFFIFTEILLLLIHPTYKDVEPLHNGTFTCAIPTTKILSSSNNNT